MSEHEFVFGGHRFATWELKHYLYLGCEESDLPVLSRLADPAAHPEPGFITDAYGIRTRTANLWEQMQPHDGQLWGVPVAGNWHWEALEWIAIMRSVLSAVGRYRIMEVGAGWGPATVAGGVLARLHGISDIGLTAVEADPHHFRFLNQHLTDNGFDPAQHRLLEAGAGRRNGWAEWPDSPDTAGEFGNRPLDRDGDYLGRPERATRKVRILSFRELLRNETVWDMMHMDIQGGEGEVCRSAMRDINERVARVCIGTHSRKLDGDLFELFMKAGWVLEGEKPAKVTYVPNAKTMEAMTSVDGTQVWRNPRLRPDPVN